MDFIRNHRKKTFVHLQISTQTHSQRSQTQHSASTQKLLAIRQPSLYIASQQTGGFSATEQRKQKFLFNITKSYTQTPYIVPTNIRQYSGSPLSPLFLLLRMNKAYRLNPSVQMARTDLKLREVLLKNSIGIFDDIRIFCGRWPIRSCHDSKGRAYCSRKPAPPWASPDGSNEPEDWIVS